MLVIHVLHLWKMSLIAILVYRQSALLRWGFRVQYFAWKSHQEGEIFMVMPDVYALEIYYYYSPICFVIWWWDQKLRSNWTWIINGFFFYQGITLLLFSYSINTVPINMCIIAATLCHVNRWQQSRQQMLMDCNNYRKRIIEGQY